MKSLPVLLFSILVFLLRIPVSYAQEKFLIKGLITDESLQPLPFASIYISDLELGLSANSEGKFEILLPKGTHEMVISFVGFAQKRMLLNVEASEQLIEIQMQTQSIVLPNANVGNKREDPAYTIMRKSIAKAQFHTLNYQKYTATVYLKGTSEVSKIPILLKRQLEEEGVVEGQPYTLESMSKIEFEQPNKVKETVISIREKGKGKQTVPNSFVQADFYKPLLAGCVSPLSPAAFYYYTFTYDGGFLENGLWINKIKVKPKTKGQQLFEGTLFLIDNLWAIHSLDLQTSLQGIAIRVKQLYRPFLSNIWLPTNQAAFFSGKIFGVKFTYQYTTVVNYSHVEANNELAFSPILLDPKSDYLPPIIKEKKSKPNQAHSFSDSSVEKTKDFAKWVAQYQKEIVKDSLGDRLTGNYEWAIDSAAYSYDEKFWDSVRPFSLSEQEKTSYQREDSFFASKTVDSLRNVSNKLTWRAVITGKSVQLTPNSTLQVQYRKGMIGFNHVEGLFLELPLRFQYNLPKNEEHALQLNTQIRYGFASRKLYGNLSGKLKLGERLKPYTIGLNLGQYIYQINPNEPISALNNSFYSLVFKANHAKWIEQKFVALTHSYDHKGKVSFTTLCSWNARNELQNNSDFSLFNQSRELESNTPDLLLSNTNAGFAQHQLLRFSINLEKRFGVSYRIYNGKKYAQLSRKPILGLNVQTGKYIGLIDNSGFSKASIYLAAMPTLLGKKGFRFRVESGAVVQGNPLGIDYFHFNGNETIFSKASQTVAFRTLPFFTYSTRSPFLQLGGRYIFEKLLITRAPLFRLSGIKESIFLNYLHVFNPAFPPYIECGYGIDNIGKFIKLEAVVGYASNDKLKLSPRIGLASFFRF